MLTDLFSPSVQHWLDIVGIFVFAISGALLGVRKNFDVFGMAVLAEVTALGGGLFRDLVIGAVPPAAFSDLGYFVTPLIATLIVFFLHPEVERITSAVNVFDAAGLGLFCVTGTVKAYAHGLGLTQSATLGLATAVGGGVLRDVLAHEVPSLLRWDRDLYAVPAMAGATTAALMLKFGALHGATNAIPVVVGCGLRLLAMRFHWRAPRAWHRRSAAAEEVAPGVGPNATPRKATRR
ncbi:trimeric intracellular cation channel family protein [Streptomyces mobaraensis NBRC 13819 = DSM 40847]|uniref:Integral membrane protein n=1 Tax=Streptomyces mobaraensis (strain ATCC 29032 / DSM 40847 / JCM 4168 / NBRC 13819 / NCIMB 11159 / IPCR 16-22) TaxID=1223523 RepID=M3C2N9_STRM1|nr:trimeric intracellular cation channel family protein [Streptomyces mobaraensis]EME98226.1 integral membrane protein [Streptomyces mobaraensis NBRC 13819 = DSM 40847]QTT75832.1 trimeric intracellular cation channel family protein [Streptomyces mobaraensis NBRC 13819 = DSM 40847]